MSHVQQLYRILINESHLTKEIISSYSSAGVLAISALLTFEENFVFQNCQSAHFLHFSINGYIGCNDEYNKECLGILKLRIIQFEKNIPVT